MLKSMFQKRSIKQIYQLSNYESIHYSCISFTLLDLVIYSLIYSFIPFRNFNSRTGLVGCLVFCSFYETAHLPGHDY